MRPSLRLLEGADAYFPALIDDIHRARRQVWLESYILNPDPATDEVMQALIAAVTRGVEVRLLLDGFGGGFGQLVWGRRLREAGIGLRLFRPGVTALSPQTWRRLHRKMVLIDGRTAYVGGINLLGDWTDPNHGALLAPRLDFAVRLEDPRVTRQIARVMARTWWRVSWHGLLLERQSLPHLAPDLKRAWQALRPGLHRAPRPAELDHPARASHRVRLLLRDNFRNRRTIEAAILAAVDGASRDVLIAMAYFIPTDPLRAALARACARGVRVRLLLQGRTEYWWSYWAERALVGKLMLAGVEVYEYHRSFLHAKVVVVDQWATLGSSNIDPFSFLLSLEANLALRDLSLIQTLRDRLEHALLPESSHRLETPEARSLTGGRAHRWRQQLVEPLMLRLALLGLRLFLAYSRRAAAVRG